jgi:hypothetical protein
MPRARRCCVSAGGSTRILLPQPTTTTSGGGSSRSSSARLSGVMSSKPLTSHSSHVSGRHRMGPSTLMVLTTNDCGRYLYGSRAGGGDGCGAQQSGERPSQVASMSCNVVQQTHPWSLVLPASSSMTPLRLDVAHLQTCGQTPQSLLRPPPGCRCVVCCTHAPASLVGAAQLLQQLGQQPLPRLLEHQTSSSSAMMAFT